MSDDTLPESHRPADPTPDSAHRALGVDTGGTFTDVVLREADGRLRVHKLLSTPQDPSQAIADGAHALLSAQALTTTRLVHGTTVATNALLERALPATALVTTAGFEDLLYIGRQARPDLYALTIEKPAPLIPRERTIGARERLDARGVTLEPLTEAEIARVITALRDLSVEAVALCLLHAYAHPAHERALAQAIRAALPELFVTASHELVPAPGEVERAQTTGTNAAIGPVMSRYMKNLMSRVQPKTLEIFLSSGGVGAVEQVAQAPIHTVLSGPAGGVVGALEAARMLGEARVITLDMGGTSTDVSLHDGAPSLREEADLDGVRVLVPTLDIFTVGAGGGSLARLDVGGALKVGPASAGADPGPACYGRGGEGATVTDAHVVLGRLRPERFLGGARTLDAEAARRAVAALAAPLGLSVEEVALGILQIADAAMGRAIKVISLERGHDPGDFAMVSFGGAGGLHACRLAEALGIPRVVVPRHPGLLSAWGMLHAPRATHLSRAVLLRLDTTDALDAEALRHATEHLRAEAADALDHRPDIAHTWSAELRYLGQSFTCRVPLTLRAGLDGFEDPSDAFAQAHARQYGWRDDARPIELVTLRLVATLPRPSTPSRDDATAQGQPPETVLACFHERTPLPTALIDRAWLDAQTSEAQQETLVGPAIITEYSGTTIMPPGWRGEVRAGHMLLRKEDV